MAEVETLLDCLGQTEDCVDLVGHTFWRDMLLDEPQARTTAALQDIE